MNAVRAERWTIRVAAAMALSLAICTALWVIDPRLLNNGDSVWLKPIRFSLALLVHLLTLAWLARLCRPSGQPLHAAFVLGLWLQVAAAVIEWTCIVLQAARGVHSHFNYATFFDHAVFMIMGWGTGLILVGMVLCGWGMARSRAEPLTKQPLLGATVLATLGGLAGVMMVMPTVEQRALLDEGQHLAWIGSTVVGDPSGRNVPFFHWDLLAGDWRAVHFVGLHALQALPLLAWLNLRAPPTRRAYVQRWALTGAWAYALFFAAVLAWTMLGRSILATHEPGWWVLATPGLLFALSAVIGIRTSGLQGVNRGVVRRPAANDQP